MSTEYIDIVVREKGTQQARQGIEAIGTAADVAARKVTALQSVMGKFTRGGGASSIPGAGGGGGGGGRVPGIIPTPNNNQLNSLRALMSTLGGTAALAGIARMANSYQNMIRTLSQFDTAARPTTQIMRELVGLANDTAQATDATVQSYTRFRIATKDLGIQHERLIPIQRTVQQLVALSTSSTQSASAAMYQFSQALASGRLQGDEFRSVMENAPRLAEAIAHGMGLPISALRHMSQQGELTAAKIITALEKMRDSVSKDFASLTLGPTQQLQRLTNNFEQAFGIIAQKSGAMATTAQVLKLMADNVTILGPLLLGLAANFGVLLLRSRAVTQTLALFGLTGKTAIGLLTGPIGWVITGVTTAILLFDKFQDSVISLGDKSATVGQIWQGLKNIFFNVLTNVGQWISTTTSNLWKSFLDATGLSWQSVRDLINNTIRGFVFLGGAVGDYVGAIPDIFRVAFDSAVNWVLKAIDRMTAGIADGINAARDILNKLPGVNITGTASGTDLQRGALGDGRSISDILAGANASIQQRGQDVANKDYVAAGVNMARGAIDTVKGALIDLADKSTTATGTVADGANKMGAALGGVADKMSELQRLGQQFDKWGEPFSQAGSDLKTLSELIKNGIIGNDKMADSVERVRQAFLRAGGTAKQWGQLIIDNVDDTAKKMQDWAVNGVRSVGDAFVDMALTGKASFGDMARSLLSDMAKIIFQATIMKSILSFLGLPTGTGFADGGAFAGGVQQFATGGVFDTPHLFKFAKGGAPSLGVLGEAGPEAILPLRRGSDGRLGVSSSGGSGGSVITQRNEITINMQGSSGDGQKDDLYIQKVMKSLTAELDARIDQRMYDNTRYGGAFAPRGA